jgi:hypothetical protein
MPELVYVIAPTQCTDALSVQPVLKILLGNSSKTKICILSNHITLAPMPSFAPSV